LASAALVVVAVGLAHVIERRAPADEALPAVVEAQVVEEKTEDIAPADAPASVPTPEAAAPVVSPKSGATTPTPAPADSADAAIVAAMVKAFGDLHTYTGETIQTKVRTMPLADLKELYLGLGAPADIVAEIGPTSVRSDAFKAFLGQGLPLDSSATNEFFVRELAADFMASRLVMLGQPLR
jgi:hypothetical protein